MSQEYRRNVLEKYRKHPHVPVDFSWEEYLRLNPNLVDKGFDTEAQALRHWIKIGRKHNLKYKLKPGEVFVPPSKTPVHKQHTQYIVQDRKKREAVRENRGEKYKIWKKHSDSNVEYDLFFERILTMIQENQEFSFIRFCDGEYHNMFTKTSPDHKVDEKHMPAISRSLLGALESKKKSLENGEKNNFLVSMQHGTDYDKIFKAYLKKYEIVTKEGYPSSLFSWAYVTDRILDLFFVINKSNRPVILVGPDYLSRISVLNSFTHVKTPAELSWLKQASIEKELFAILEELVAKRENPLVLYACSITGKMALIKAYEKYPESLTQIDVGSNLSPFCGVVSRGWQKPERFTLVDIDQKRKAYCVSTGDRTGSQINEELFTFAYCIKNHLEYTGCLDRSNVTDRDGSRFEKHVILSKFLNLPLPQDSLAAFADQHKIEERDYSRDVYPDTNALIDDLFIDRVQSLYYSQNKFTKSSNLQVAVHIRRGDVKSDNAMRFIPNEYYLEKIQMIREMDPEAEIRVFTETTYSLTQDETEILQEEVQEDFGKFKDLGCIMMIDTDIQEAWRYMIHADIFLMAKSSFSWVPALYNRNFVVYYPAWYQMINRWHSSDDFRTWHKLKEFVVKRQKKNEKESWERMGKIFDDHHAQLPVCSFLQDRIRIYYSTRVEGKSTPLYIEVDSRDPSHVVYKHRQPLLNHGKPGSFDHFGVMPTCWLEKDGLQYLYYIGWSRREDVPYHNSLGLATSKDGLTWKKYSEGPVFSTSYKEPGYIGTAEILIEDGIWKMWYLSCRDWILHQGRMEPIYDIKYAISSNGFDWEPQGKAVDLWVDEGGISAARVIRLEDGSYEMYFSSRGKVDYRSQTELSYRIRKAVSPDGINWTRINTVEFDVSFESWEDFMVCYPALVKTETDLLLFYNGNGFGKTGIGYAKKI